VRQATNAMDHLDKSKLPSISAASALRRSRRFLLRGRSTVNLSVALRKAVSTSSTRVFRTCLTTRCISTIRSSMSPKLTLSRSQVPTVPSLAYASLRSLFSRVSKGMNRIYSCITLLSTFLICSVVQNLSVSGPITDESTSPDTMSLSVINSLRASKLRRHLLQRLMCARMFS
jgi:hypothetical protein